MPVVSGEFLACFVFVLFFGGGGGVGLVVLHQ